MSDGSIVISTELDNKELEKKLRASTRKIESLEEKLSTQKDARNPLAEKAAQLGVALDEANAKLERLRAVGAQPAAIAEQAETVRSLSAQFNVADSALQNMEGKIRTNTAELERQKEKAGGLAQEINGASAGSSRMAEAVKRAEKNAQRFSVRMKSVVTSALVFTVVSKSLALFRDWVGKVIKTNTEARESIARLKGALLTMAQPLVRVIIPAFTALVNVLARVITAIAKVVSWIFGTTYEKSKESAEQLSNEIDAIDGVGEAAKKAEKSLASFDEINQLSDGADTGRNMDTIAADFSAITGGFLSGLTFTLEDVLLKWKNLTKEDILAKIITALTTLAGVAIGFSLGGPGGAVIGMALGAVLGLAISNLTMDGDGKLSTEEVAKLAALALGALVDGIIGFSIGGPAGALIVMTLGAGATVAISKLLFNNDGVISAEEIAKGIAVALGALVGGVLGFLAGGPAGALIVMTLGAGATLYIANTIFDNDGVISEKEIARMLCVALGALVGGIIGFSIGGPAGALICGAISGAVTMNLLDMSFSDVVSAVAKNAAKIAFYGMIGALIGAIFGGGIFGGIVGGVIGLTFGLAVTLSDAKVKDNTGLGGQANLGSGAGRKFIAPTGAPSAFSAPLPPIPMLARGAVIPPNREFMAVLGDQKNGTNIEAPLSTIEQAVENVISRRGYNGGGSGGMTLMLDGDLAALARVLNPYMVVEGRRVGVKLVTGGV